jgi:hypothetical protein
MESIITAKGIAQSTGKLHKLAALCKGMPIEATARMFKAATNTITRIIRETGEAFADYMDANFRDLPCERVELDEQWQWVGCHKGRMSAPEPGRGDFWLWAAIDSDTKLVFSHRIGKRDWITGNTFVEDVSNRVRGARPDRHGQSSGLSVSYSATLWLRRIFIRHGNKDIRRAKTTGRHAGSHRTQ